MTGVCGMLGRNSVRLLRTMVNCSLLSLSRRKRVKIELLRVGPAQLINTWHPLSNFNSGACHLLVIGSTVCRTLLLDECMRPPSILIATLTGLAWSAGRCASWKPGTLIEIYLSIICFSISSCIVTKYCIVALYSLCDTIFLSNSVHCMVLLVLYVCTLNEWAARAPSLLQLKNVCASPLFHSIPVKIP